ncbi:hypothetical protein D3C74_365350 [compost metagenome]
MKNIKYIDIVLENCEVIRVKKEHIYCLSLSNITRSIHHSSLNNTLEFIEAKGTFIKLLLQGNYMDAFLDPENWKPDYLPFSRLQEHHDITHVDVIYEDDSNEYISVNWGGDSDYSNSNQKTVLDMGGNLLIGIGEEDEVKEFFKAWGIEEELK